MKDRKQPSSLFLWQMAVPVPDLEIRGRGVWPWDKRRGGGAFSKNFFRPFGSQFGLKIRGGPGPPPLNPPLNDSSQGSLFQSPVTFGDPNSSVWRLLTSFYIASNFVGKIRCDVTYSTVPLMPIRICSGIISFVLMSASLKTYFSLSSRHYRI